MVNIAIYGGSFDPFGEHHKCVLESIQKDFDTIFVVPSIQNPLKDKSILFEHRLNMIELSLEKNSWKNVIIDSIERQLLKKYCSPIKTWMVIEYYKNLYPNSKISFIIGEDLILQINQWEMSEEIKKYMLPIPEIKKIHSTQIRDMIKNNNSDWKKYVCNPTIKYIELHGLYK